MKIYLFPFVLIAIGCAGKPQVPSVTTAADPQQRAIAASNEIIAVITNRSLQGFLNSSNKPKVATIGELADYGVAYKGNKYSCLFSFKTPAYTNGTVNPGRVFYARMGDCRVFSKYETAPNGCLDPVLQLFNTEKEAQSMAEPVAIIEARVPGNPTTIYAQDIEEYVDLIKGCFDMDTANRKSRIPFKGVTDRAL